MKYKLLALDLDGTLLMRDNTIPQDVADAIAKLMEALVLVGAAIATVVSRMVETAVIVYFVFCRDKRLGFRLRHILLRDKLLAKDYLKYGLPIVAGDIVWSVNMMCNSGILGSYGAEVITAACSTCNVSGLGNRQ